MKALDLKQLRGNSVEELETALRQGQADLYTAPKGLGFPTGNGYREYENSPTQYRPNSHGNDRKEKGS